MDKAIDIHLRSGGHDLEVHLAMKAEEQLLDFIKFEFEAIERGGDK